MVRFWRCDRERGRAPGPYLIATLKEGQSRSTVTSTSRQASTAWLATWVLEPPRYRGQGSDRDSSGWVRVLCISSGGADRAVRALRL